MINTFLSLYGWKLALIGMAAYRQRLVNETWPFAGAQKEVARIHVVQNRPVVVKVQSQ